MSDVNVGDIFVFEYDESQKTKLRQLSIALETIYDANSFVETMKEGMYYKSMRPDIELVTMQVLSIGIENKKLQD